MLPARSPMSIPGVTLELPGSSKKDGELPSIIEALKKGEDETRDSRPGKLTKIARRAFEAHQWYYREATECVALYNGAQWGYWSTDENRYIATPETKSRWELRITMNLTKPAVDQATAILTTEEPIFIAGAAKTEVADSASANVVDDLIAVFWRQNRLANLYRLSARNAYVAGTDFVHPHWDTTKGRPILVKKPMMVPAGVGPDGQPVLEPQMVDEQTFEGDVEFEHLSRSQVAFDPAATNDVDGAYIVIRKRISRSERRDRFPNAKGGVSKERNTSEDGALEQAEAADRYSPYGSGYGEDGKDDESGIVYLIYVRKCADYPRGYACWVDEMDVLWEGENPVYPTEDEGFELMPRVPWPVFAIRCDERETSPWGRGRCVDAAEPQKAINGLISKALSHVAIIANGKIMLPASLGIEWSDEIGQVIRVGRQTSPNQIGYVQPPPMPSEYTALYELKYAALQTILGINQASQGALPAADTSGRALQLLQQRDMGRLGPVKRMIDGTWGEILVTACRFWRRYSQVARKELVLGANRSTELVSFEKAQLGQAIDVIVANDNSIPRDPMAKLLWMTQFTQSWGQAEPELRSFIMRAWRLQEFNTFLEEKDPHGVKADRNNQKIMNGVQPEYWEGDDHLTHKAALERLATSEEYELRVAEEKASPMFGGQSPTEYFTLSLWQQHTQALIPQQPAAPGMSPGGQAPGGPQAAPAMTPANGVAMPRPMAA